MIGGRIGVRVCERVTVGQSSVWVTEKCPKATVVAVAHREWGEIRTAPIPTQRAGSGFLLDSSPSPQNGLGAGMGLAFSVVWLLRLGSHAEGVENE